MGFYRIEGIMLNRIAWPSILELSYKRSIFYVQVRAGTVSNSISKIGFLCPTSGTAKRIWRISMEHHHFFRKEVSKPEGGSKLLLKSRTQAELITELDQNISRVSAGKITGFGVLPKPITNHSAEYLAVDIGFTDEGENDKIVKI